MRLVLLHDFNTLSQLKVLFQQSSGDLLLSLCELLSVSWQVMVDDKISGQFSLLFMFQFGIFFLISLEI
jgi:hypothetical protein